MGTSDIYIEAVLQVILLLGGPEKSAEAGRGNRKLLRSLVSRVPEVNIIADARNDARLSRRLIVPPGSSRGSIGEQIPATLILRRVCHDPIVER